MGACVSGRAGGSCLGQNDDPNIVARQGDLAWTRVSSSYWEIRALFSIVFIFQNSLNDDRDEFVDKV